jgi:hypothetical protein
LADGAGEVRQRLSRTTAICWIIACVLLLALMSYDMLAPCGLRAFEKDTHAWATRGCIIEQSPADTWRNLFSRER